MPREAARPARRGVEPHVHRARSRSRRASASGPQAGGQRRGPAFRPRVTGQVALAVEQDRRDPSQQEVFEQGQRHGGLAAAAATEEDGVPGEFFRVEHHRLRHGLAGAAQVNRTGSPASEWVRRRPGPAVGQVPPGRGSRIAPSGRDDGGARPLGQRCQSAATRAIPASGTAAVPPRARPRSRRRRSAAAKTRARHPSCAIRRPRSPRAGRLP